MKKRILLLFEVVVLLSAQMVEAQYHAIERPKPISTPTPNELYYKAIDAFDSTNYYTAAKYFLQAAEQGHVEAKFHLGIMYEEGKGLHKDYDNAIKWYLKAAEQGYTPAQYNLGMLYLTDKQYMEAFNWFLKAAEQGHAGAQNNLGVMYEKGIGVEMDSKEAEKWYRKADAQGTIYGVKMLGRKK